MCIALNHPQDELLFQKLFYNDAVAPPESSVPCGTVGGDPINQEDQ